MRLIQQLSVTSLKLSPQKQFKAHILKNLHQVFSPVALAYYIGPIYLCVYSRLNTVTLVCTKTRLKTISFGFKIHFWNYKVISFQMNPFPHWETLVLTLEVAKSTPGNPLEVGESKQRVVLKVVQSPARAPLQLELTLEI
jgi:hypothetical protein